eukprot:351963-Chlamydomonas_euryale.AAC.4
MPFSPARSVRKREGVGDGTGSCMATPAADQCRQITGTPCSLSVHSISLRSALPIHHCVQSALHEHTPTYSSAAGSLQPHAPREHNIHHRHTRLITRESRRTFAAVVATVTYRCIGSGSFRRSLARCRCRAAGSCSGRNGTENGLCISIFVLASGRTCTGKMQDTLTM